MRYCEVKELEELIEMAKQRLQVTIREDLVRWIDQGVEKLKFANRSHAIEFALLKLKETEKKE
jgi:Arc/MetJ-type ribon-helix-helix transcriptional regulator